jgi:AraC family transcriptional regulator
MAAPSTLAPVRAYTGKRAASAAARVEAVETVIEAIGERLDRPFELEEMARIAYLSPFYFNRVFRQITGLPPRRFQTALRMVAAKRMLLTSDLSVTEICLEVGYRSLGTFVTQFRQLVGVSPRTLRRMGEQPWPLQAVPPAAPPVQGGTVSGVVDVADVTPRITFVGAFAEASPQGIPRACSMLSGPGPRRYRLAGVPPGRHHIAAAAIPCSTDPRSYLLPDASAVRVAIAPREVVARADVPVLRDLRLRPMRTTDPPILLVPQAVLAAA